MLPAWAIGDGAVVRGFGGLRLANELRLKPSLVRQAGRAAAAAASAAQQARVVGSY
jgi:hypothetical protein